MINYDDLLEQNPWWQGKVVPEESGLPRRMGLDDIRAGFVRSFPQVLLGLRRVGKSTVMRQLTADVLAEGTDPRHVLYFSFDKYAVEKTPAALETILKLYFERALQARIHEINFRCHLFIDEIQYVDYWQDIVKRYYDQNKRLKFFLTGSQSSRLRGKSKESLAGRVMEYHLPPLSFPEYRMLIGEEPLDMPPVFDLKEREWLSALQEFHHKAGARIDSQMPAYLCQGQFPEVVAESNKDISQQYIRESVLGKMLEKDLPDYYGIEHGEAFKAMAYHLLTNSGSLFQLANIGSDLGISKATVEKYFGYLRDSALVGVMHTHSRSGIKKGRSLKKAYAGSANFITAINKYTPDFYGRAPEVFGKVVETYVWWRLSRRFENLDLWRRGQEEVDFMAADAGRTCLPLETKFGARMRSEELRPLLSLMGAKRIRRGFVVTRDRVDSLAIDGRRIDLFPFYLL